MVEVVNEGIQIDLQDCLVRFLLERQTDLLKLKDPGPFEQNGLMLEIGKRPVAAARITPPMMASARPLVCADTSSVKSPWTWVSRMSRVGASGSTATASTARTSSPTGFCTASLHDNARMGDEP